MKRLNKIYRKMNRKANVDIDIFKFLGNNSDKIDEIYDIVKFFAKGNMDINEDGSVICYSEEASQFMREYSRLISFNEDISIEDISDYFDNEEELDNFFDTCKYPVDRQKNEIIIPANTKVNLGFEAVNGGTDTIDIPYGNGDELCIDTYLDASKSSPIVFYFR